MEGITTPVDDPSGRVFVIGVFISVLLFVEWGCPADAGLVKRLARARMCLFYDFHLDDVGRDLTDVRMGLCTAILYATDFYIV